MRPLHWPLREPITLDDAISAAISRSPAIRARIAVVEARIARIYETTSGYQPKVTLVYDATRFEQPLGAPFFTSIFGQAALIQAAPFTLSQFEDRFQVTQLLSDGGQTHALVMSRVASARGAFAMLIDAVHRLQYDVRAACISVAESAARLEVARSALDNAKAHLRMARAQYQAGAVARADIVFSRTPVTRARIALTRSLTHLQDAQAHLASLIGSDPGFHLRFDEKSLLLPDPGATLSGVRQMALQRRLDLQARHCEVKASMAALVATRRANSVTIQATASYQFVGYQTREAVPQHPGWSAGIEVTYPLFDGGLTHARIHEQQARVAEARDEANQLARNIDEEAVTAWNALQTARMQVTVCQAEIAQARESVRMARGQYGAGAATNLQVLDAQLSLDQAHRDMVAAHYEVLRAVARILLVTGR